VSPGSRPKELSRAGPPAPDRTPPIGPRLRFLHVSGTTSDAPRNDIAARCALRVDQTRRRRPPSKDGKAAVAPHPADRIPSGENVEAVNVLSLNRGIGSQAGRPAGPGFQDALIVAMIRTTLTHRRETKVTGDGWSR